MNIGQALKGLVFGIALLCAGAAMAEPAWVSHADTPEKRHAEYSEKFKSDPTFPRQYWHWLNSNAQFRAEEQKLNARDMEIWSQEEHRKYLQKEKEREWEERVPYLIGGIVLLLLVLWLLYLWKGALQRAAYSSDQSAMSYERYDLMVSVDKDKQLVIVNGKPIKPAEFSYVANEIMEKRYGNTGGNQTVYGTRGEVGTVYVPGASFSYDERTGFAADIYKQANGHETTVASVKFKLKGEDAYNALQRVLGNIQTWCASVAQGSAANALDDLCAKAGIDKERFDRTRWGRNGELLETIVVDRSGKAALVYNEGTETWIGSIKGASSTIVNQKLEIKVDDPVYRKKHLTERRFAILDNEAREVLTEWEDRFNLLAKQNTDALSGAALTK